MAVVIETVGVCSVRGIGDESTLDIEATPCFQGAPLAQFRARRVGLVPAFDPVSVVTRKKDIRLMNRASLLAVAPARAAVGGRAIAGDDAGLFMAVGMSGGEISELAGLIDASVAADGGIDYAAMGRDGLARLHPLLSFHVLNNMPLCHVSIELGLRGPHAAVLAPGEEALAAFERAALAVTSGETRSALCGGVDAPVNTISLALADGRARLAEGAGLALVRFAAAPMPGAITWRGLRRPTGRADDAEMDVCITVGGGRAPRAVKRTYAIEDVVGETLAASGALAVALAVRLLRHDDSLGTVGISAPRLGLALLDRVPTVGGK